MDIISIVFLILIIILITVVFFIGYYVKSNEHIKYIVLLGAQFIIWLCVFLITSLILREAEEPTSEGIKFPGIRTEAGDYESGHIVTEDGHIWDYDNPNSVFYDGEQVIVLFDINGTEAMADDTILDVHSLEY